MKIHTVRVRSVEDRLAALEVVRAVYLEEKAWIRNLDAEIPIEDVLGCTRFTWFLALVDGRPAGLIRLQEDPSIVIPPELEPVFEKDIDLEKIAANTRLAEIGRFMIVPDFRRSIVVAIRLMQAAVRFAVVAGATHLLTDVFENDPHSPLQFHTRVLGFERIGTHRFGELNCASRRIILVLDIAAAYHRLKVRDNKVFREIAAGLADLLDRRPLAATA